MRLVRCNNSIPQTNTLMNHFFGSDDFDTLWGGQRYFTPKVNIQESDEQFSIEVAAPGYNKKDFNVEVENDVLTIEAKRKEEKKDRSYSHYEFNYSNFSRSFTLPENKVKESKISASYENGILKIELPKLDEAKPKPKRLIDIF